MPRDEDLARLLRRALQARRAMGETVGGLNHLLQIEMVHFDGPCAVCGTHVEILVDRGSFPVPSERMCPNHRQCKWFRCWLCNWQWLGYKAISSEVCVVCYQEVCTWCSELKSAHTRARMCLEHRANPWFCDVCFTHAEGTFGNCWTCAVRCCEECSEDMGTAPRGASKRE